MVAPDDAGALFALSIRTARETRGLSREAVVYELTKLGSPVSVSTLLRWERDGSIKAEDAYYLSQVYDMTIDELLLRAVTSGAGAEPAQGSASSVDVDQVGQAVAGRKASPRPKPKPRRSSRQPES